MEYRNQREERERKYTIQIKRKYDIKITHLSKISYKGEQSNNSRFDNVRKLIKQKLTFRTDFLQEKSVVSD